MKTLDTRDLAKRLEELRDLQRAIDDARDELKEAEDALNTFKATHAEPGDDDDRQIIDEDAAWHEQREDLETAVEEAQTALEIAQAGMDDGEREELKELEELESEISEWRHGETLIPEHSFEEYAREIAEETGDLKHADSWPYTCIDWEQAAKELAMDYSLVSYQGESYYIRA